MISMSSVLFERGLAVNCGAESMEGEKHTWKEPNFPDTSHLPENKLCSLARITVDAKIAPCEPLPI